MANKMKTVIDTDVWFAPRFFSRFSRGSLVSAKFQGAMIRLEKALIILQQLPKPSTMRKKPNVWAWLLNSP